jgi:alginate O-acetyltransferase complex protein AlgJ
MRNLNRNTLRTLGTLTPLLLALSTAHAQDAPPGIVGKDGWIFYNHEFVRDVPESDVSANLVAKISRILQDNGTTVLVALAPIKARIYSEYLPSNRTLTAEHRNDYNRLLAQLKAKGAHTVDLNSAFLNSPKRNGEFPLYFKQDTHWGAPGAMLAGETIRDAINADPVTKQAYDSTPSTAYTVQWATQAFDMTGDLVEQLPPNAPKFAPEKTTAFDLNKTNDTTPLVGDAATSGVALLGSSYTAEWTFFPKAMRYALQRDVPSLSMPATLGQWYGLDAYMRNDAFQTARPKLLIWEMPERDMKAAPSMPYREARYVMENDVWLARVSALAQKSCQSSGNAIAISGKPAPAKGSSEFMVGSTAAGDFAEITLAKTSSYMEYLTARLKTNGSKLLTLEMSGGGNATRQFQIETAGDEAEHAFTIPVWGNGKGYTKVKFMPGDTKGFSVKGLDMCKQPDSLKS